MTTTNFIDKQTVIVADWLNDVDAHVYNQEASAHDADNLDYTISGTGASTRTVKDKLGEIVSVKDFGAVGDGVTDDTAAFLNATAEGRLTHVNYPPTSYKFTNALDVTTAPLFFDPAATWSSLTDSGKLKAQRGANTSSADGCSIWRFGDRVFVGEASSTFAGDSSVVDGGTSWFDLTTAGYLGINATLLVTNNKNPYGVVSAVRTSNTGNHSIAFGASAMADHSQKTAWGLITELDRLPGAWYAFGIEVAAKNRGANGIMTPNGTATTGVYGLWLAGGGDDNVGAVAPTNPSTCGIVVLKNSHTWNTGICFQKDALTNGEAIALSSEGVGGAHTLRWYNAAGNSVFNFRANTSSDTAQWTLERYNSGIQITAEGASLFTVNKAANAVNGVAVFAGATTSAPNISAISSVDTNVDLRLSGKGTGVIRFGTWTSNADAAINGYITIKDSAGNVRKLATIA